MEGISCLGKGKGSGKLGSDPNFLAPELASMKVLWFFPLLQACVDVINNCREFLDSVDYVMGAVL